MTGRKLQNKPSLFTSNVSILLIKAAAVILIIVGTRALFQLPIDLLSLELLKQSQFNRVFSKIDALKILVIVGLFFALYYRDEIAKISHNWKWRRIIFLVIAEILIIAYYALRVFLNIQSPQGIYLFLGWFGIVFLLAVAFLFFVLGIFGFPYVSKFFSIFKERLILAGAIGIVLYLLLLLVQEQWLFFSKVATIALYYLLSPFYDIAFFFTGSGPLFIVDGFSVVISSPCSGIDSMFLYLCFFAGIFALDFQRLHMLRFFLLAIVGLAGVFVLNIIRLYLLLLVGIHYNPELAIGLFHTNAGWVLFVGYFLVYYWIVKQFAYQNQNK